MDREAWIKEAMRLADDFAEIVAGCAVGGAGTPSSRAALEVHLRTMMEGEPVAYMWQHEETGRFGFLAAGYDVDAWRKFNPRLKIVCPLYTHPTIPEGELARCTSCDSTGDLIRADGEWLGYCSCAIGRAAKAGPVIPEGMALVPLEPDELQIHAGYDATRDAQGLPPPGFVFGHAVKVYKAMIQAHQKEAGKESIESGKEGV